MHYKLIATKPDQIWGTEFDSRKAADDAATWLAMSGYTTRVFNDPEYENEEEEERSAHVAGDAAQS